MDHDQLPPGPELTDAETASAVIAGLRGDKANLIASQANELALIGLARDCERAEAEAKVTALTEAMREACGLLAERRHGNPARSAGHNARLCLESALALSPIQSGEGG